AKNSGSLGDDLWTECFQVGEGQAGLFNGVAIGRGGLQICEAREMAAVSLGQREGAEIQASNDGERAQRTNEQFVQIVAGDILYDAAAAFAERAFAVNKLRADQKIA